MKTIAVIDDDIYIGNMLEEVLKKEGYGVVRAYSGTEAIYMLAENSPDLVLLDLMLPGLSGEEVLAKIKDVPVIILSAKVDTGGKVKLIKEGAADYVTKPFDTGELLARIEARLRESAGNPNNPVLSCGSISVNTATHSVTAGGTDVHLTKTEYAILKLLIKNRNNVVTKSVILDEISLDTPDCMESSLKVHISNLRKKLRVAGGRDCIESVWGIGFKINAD